MKWRRARIQVMFFVLLTRLLSIADAADYARLCTLKQSEILAVVYDEESGVYVVINETGLFDRNKTMGGGRQLLRASSVVPAIAVSTNRRIQSSTNITGPVHYVRQCQCTYRPEDSDLYCPLDKSTCGVPKSSTEPIGCFNQSSRTSLIRNAWPVIVLWYGGLLIFLVFTTQGQNARHFVIVKCCKRNLNERVIEQYWYVEGGFWRRRRRPRRPPIRRENAGEQEVPPLPQNTLNHLVEEDHAPNQLALKTKRYVAPRVVEDEDDVSCTICFSPLEEGDRVGALPCSHTFHVDCLKEWLPRRNTCPLCQVPNVAIPQYQPQTSQDVNRGGSNSIVESSQAQSVRNESSQQQQQSPLHTDDIQAERARHNALSAALQEHLTGMQRRGNFGVFYGARRF